MGITTAAVQGLFSVESFVLIWYMKERKIMRGILFLVSNILVCSCWCFLVCVCGCDLGG